MTGYEIQRDESGKPIVHGETGGPAFVSLAHDARYCVATAGRTAQGVDIEPVVERTEHDWGSLLGEAQMPLVARLGTSEGMSVAGTRVWTVREAAFKALGTFDGSIEVSRRADDAVLFEVRTTDGKNILVLTQLLRLTLGQDRIVAMVVKPHQNGTTPSMPMPVNQRVALAAAGYDPSSLSMDGDANNRHFILRWPVTFKEAANLDGSVYFSNYAEWMGKVREIAMQPIAAQIGDLMTSRKWAMVTNFADVKVTGGARLGDIIEARYWVRPSTDPLRADSTVELYFDWTRRSPDGSTGHAANGRMSITWVSVVGHGLVKPEPLPEFFVRFIEQRTPPGEDVAAPVREGQVGTTLWQKPAGPDLGPQLHEQVFQTSLADANLVGNIYFSNYFVWQGRVLDAHLHHHTKTSGGAPVCVAARVEHLVDAMPFDDIRVTLSLAAVRDDGLDVDFVYHRMPVGGGAPAKLAIGHQVINWTVGTKPSVMPKKVREELLGRVS